MKKITMLLLACFVLFGIAFGQAPAFDKIGFILGEWSGTGGGFGNEKSKITSSFKLVMDGKYVEVKNDSKFEPTEKNPDGEHHIDQGYISFDKGRKKLVFRQFNIEGFVNQYIYNDSLSTDAMLVFETEIIENFMPGGSTRWTIKKMNDHQIETTFDVSLANKEYTCYGINKLTKNEIIMNDLPPKATGIGGIFFFSDHPKETKEWYAENLGLEITEYGSSFEFRNANRPDEINYLQWSPFKKGSSYFEPSKKEFMINYRVQNIEALVLKLKENGVTIVDEIESYSYGKFVHIMDLEGNKLELWEPVDKVFTDMGGKTTK